MKKSPNFVQKSPKTEKLLIKIWEINDKSSQNLELIWVNFGAIL
jgi:hypothetical protein